MLAQLGARLDGFRPSSAEWGASVQIARLSPGRPRYRGPACDATTRRSPTDILDEPPCRSCAWIARRSRLGESTLPRTRRGGAGQASGPRWRRWSSEGSEEQRLRLASTPEVPSVTGGTRGSRSLEAEELGRTAEQAHMHAPQTKGADVRERHRDTGRPDWRLKGAASDRGSEFQRHGGSRRDTHP